MPSERDGDTMVSRWRISIIKRGEERFPHRLRGRELLRRSRRGSRTCTDAFHACVRARCVNSAYVAPRPPRCFSLPFFFSSFFSKRPHARALRTQRCDLCFLAVLVISFLFIADDGPRYVNVSLKSIIIKAILIRLIINVYY